MRLFPFLKKKKAEALTPQQNKQIQAAIPQAQADGAAQDGQQSIPFQRMFEDGTCRVHSNYYTRTIQFQDINFQLAQQEDKTAIFEELVQLFEFFRQLHPL